MNTLDTARAASEALRATGWTRRADAVDALIAEREAPVTDAQVEEAAAAFWLAGGQGNEILAPMRAALEAARGA